MKRILTLAVSIMILGTMAFALTGCSDSPFIKALQNTSNKEKNITASFDGIEIVSDTADLTLVASDECKIEYTTHKRIIYSTEVENGILKIKLEDNRRWFQKIFSFDDSSKLTVYLPAGEYSSLTIRQDTGDITVPADYKFGSANIDLSTGDTKLSASVDGSLRIHASTGSITLENVSCGTLDTKVSTGKTALTNVAVAGDATVNASSGDMSLNKVSFKNLSTTADTGDLNAIGLTGEGLSIERNTGEVGLNDVNCGGKVAVQTTTGKIDATNVTCGDMTVTVSSGKTAMSNVSCISFTSTGNTGDIDMTSLIASEKIDITRTTGDVTFDRCDAAEITVSVSTGDVTGTLLTPKIFQAHSTTGKINVPEYWEGGKCKITTTTGKIEISIDQ